MARQKGSRPGRCQGCNHLERVRIERLLASGASIKAAARKFAIDHHALRRHWHNHVSAEARALYVAGPGAGKDELQEIVADETLALIDHYRIVRGAELDAHN
jgi:transposase-like protein